MAEVESVVNSNRVKTVEVSSELWQKIMTTGSHTELHCKKGLPEGAKLQRIFYDPQPWINAPPTVVFVFEHPSFEIIPEGGVIPRLFPEYIEASE